MTPGFGDDLAVECGQCLIRAVTPRISSSKQMTPTPQQPGLDPANRRARSPVAAKTTLTWLAMAMLTLGSVGDLGATPATAVLGLASVVIYVLPAIVFLLPASLVSAEL